MAVTFRTMGPRELALALDWAAAEGWNPGLDDAAAFPAADPEGFFLAELDGAPAASISMVNHAPDHAFLGLYICRPEFRGRGVGYALWRHALAHAGDRTVGLDGVPAQQGNYRKSGFVPAGATLRWEGAFAPAADPEVRAMAAADLPALTALDAAAGGVRRLRFPEARVAAPRATVVPEGPEGPTGFAVIRECRGRPKVGPAIAPDAGAALRLIGAAAQAAGAREVVADVAESNAALSGALAARGLSASFSTARMYRGRPPASGPGLQAVATLELG